MIKSWNEMRQVDVSQHTKQRDGATYLPWAKCVQLLHDNGAENVYFEPLTNASGSSLFMAEQTFTDKRGDSNRAYEVRVRIVIDDIEFTMNYPVINGMNSVKDGSLNQQRVATAQARAFVKGVAIKTGLGFGLWMDEDDDLPQTDDLSKHSIFAIKERLQQLYTKAFHKGMSTSEIASAVGLSEEEVKVIFTYPEILDRFEKKLMSL